MATTGVLELVEAIRLTQLTNATLSAAGIFLTRATREDALPYLLNSVQASTPVKRLRGDAFRTVTMLIKACAAAGATEAVEAAAQLKNLSYSLFFDVYGLGDATLLNTKLTPLGWKAMTPMEVGEVGPYADYIGDLERWHSGNLIEFRIQKL